MGKVVLAVVFALALTGCTTTAPYGNYLDESSALDQDQLAGEAVDQLVSLYPPARSRFELQQPAPDAFGTALIRRLRDNGYAVLEYQHPTAPAAKSAAEEDTDAPAIDLPSASQSYLLAYVMDTAGDPDLYRLTLLIGSQSLSRLYALQDGELLPASYWMRGE